MTDVKRQIEVNLLNKQIKEEEDHLKELEEKIQKEKSDFGTIVAYNEAAANKFVKLFKVVSSVLFGMGVAYALAENLVYTLITLGTSIITYGGYTLATRLDKHDKGFRKRCVNNVEELKHQAKRSKVILFELYSKADKLEKEENLTGIVTRDLALEEEIKDDLKKTRYSLVRDKMIERSITHKSKYDIPLNEAEQEHIDKIEIQRHV